MMRTCLCMLLSVGLVAGCLESDEPDVETDINIVLVLPLTGAFQARGEVHQSAVQMAIRDLTAGEDLLPNRDTRLWLVDSTSDEEEAERRLRQLIEEQFTAADGSYYVAGIISSSEPAQIASLRVALELEVPHFEISSGIRWDEGIVDSSDARAHALAFTAQPIARLEAVFAAEYIASRDVWERMVIMRGDKEADRTHTKALRSRLAQLNWSGRILNEPEDEDIVMEYGSRWRDYLTPIAEMDTDVHLVYFKISGDTNVQDFLADANLLDLYPNLVTSGVTLDEKLLDAVNPGIVGYLDNGNYSFATRSPVSPELGNPYLEAFQTDFQRFVADNPIVEDYELWAPAAYDAAMALGLGIAAANSTDGYEVAAAIEAISKDGEQVGYGETARALDLIRQGMDIDYDGASGPFDIRNDSIDGSSRDTAHAVPGELRVFEVRYSEGDDKGAYVPVSEPAPQVL